MKGKVDENRTFLSPNFEDKTNNKNLSHIFKMCHKLGYSKEYLSLIFQSS
jgi:hypothetical protein